MTAIIRSTDSQIIIQNDTFQQKIMETKPQTLSLTVLLKQLKKIIFGQRTYQEKKQKILTLIQGYEKLDQKTKGLIELYIQLSQAGPNEKIDNQMILQNQEEKQFMHYWRECHLMLQKKESQCDIRSLLWEGQNLILFLSSKIKEKSFSGYEGSLKLLLFNNSILYFKLQMYQEAIRNLQAAMKCSSTQDDNFIINVGQLNELIHIKMEVNSNNLNLNFLQRGQGRDYLNSNSSLNQFKQLVAFLRVKKNQLPIFIRKQSLKKSKIHIRNYYNLALICKKHHLNSIAIKLLQNLIKECQTEQTEIIRIKSYVLLSQVYEDDHNLQASVSCLEKIFTVDLDISEQIKIKIILLKKQIKLKKAAASCPAMALSQNKQYHLLSNIQNELNKLVKKQQPILHKVKRVRNFLPKFKTLKITNPRVNVSNKYVISCRPSVNVQKSSQLRYREFRTTIRQAPTATASPQTPPTPPSPSSPSSSTKSIHLISKNMDERLLAELLVQCQQKIINFIAQSKFEEATVEIENMVNQLQELDNQSEQQVFNFRLKCINWCYKLGKKRYVVLLLKRFIKLYREKQNTPNLISLLHQLSKNYEQTGEYNKAININSEIFQLGQTDALDKIGQLHILCQNYSQSLACYEQYDKIKKSIYTRVKLAHAYSKILGCTKKTIQILQDILFSNKKDLIYKKFTREEIPIVQNAVLLLSTMYMNMGSIQKAIDVCEKHLLYNFEAYPILYLLGIMHFRKGNLDKAFKCLVNSLRLKPDHLPSLLELVNYIGTNQFHNQQILKILRKAFISNHRDWQLLKLVISVLTKSEISQRQLNIQNLIQFAHILQQHPDIQYDCVMEIEAVWLWAMELMQDRKKKLSIIDSFDEYSSTIYLRLGQINLQKGNYPLSEIYFNKILLMIQMEKMRLTKNKANQQHIQLQINLLRKLAFIKSQQQKCQQAINLLEQSYRIATTNLLKAEADEDFYKIGLVYLEFGQYSAALKQLQLILEKVIKEEINNDEQFQMEQNLKHWINVQMKIAQCYSGLGQMRQAKKTYQTIINRKMEEKAIRQLIAIYIKEGNYECAEQLQQSLYEYLEGKSQSCKSVYMP